jgi:threonylcarbamoyladenosine tRNA methylthiotransferase MtaB
MRLQLGSLEPRIVTPEFVATIVGRVVPKFHLSLQSGYDATLARMNRRYGTARFKQSVELLRSAYDAENAAPAFISADVIVGFPGETDEEFEQTLEFVSGLNLSSLHVFPYSPRPGTVAADLPNQVDKAVKLERARRLRAVNPLVE